jgi:hypothetical protein
MQALTACAVDLCGEARPVSVRSDDGVGNSDTTPDACRTTYPPFCGDGIVGGNGGLRGR